MFIVVLLVVIAAVGAALWWRRRDRPLTVDESAAVDALVGWLAGRRGSERTFQPLLGSNGPGRHGESLAKTGLVFEHLIAGRFLRYVPRDTETFKGGAQISG